MQMSELVKYDAGFSYNQEQIELIKNTIAKGATNDELTMFTTIAQKYGLDPFLKEIWFIKRAKKVKDSKGNWDYKKLPNGEIDYTGAETLIYTSRDGYLKIAQRDTNFAGIISFPVREGDIFEVDAENYKVTHKFGLKRGDIIGAWCKVDHKKHKPVIVYADFKEYNETNSTTWKKYPSAMIQKVAEVLALKRQFGISGLVTKEEMSSVIEEEETVPEQPKPEPQQPKSNQETIIYINEVQAEAMKTRLERLGTLESALKYYNITGLKELTTEQYSKLNDSCNKKEKEKEKEKEKQEKDLKLQQTFSNYKGA